MSMEMWYQVKKFSDGENLNAKTLNVPIGQLGARTDYLYERLSELMSGDKLSSVVITGVTLSTKEGEYPEVGNAVYLHQNEDEEGIVASKAKATMSMYDDFMAAESAFTIGILSSRNDTTGNVIVYGKMALGSDGQISKDDIIESGEAFRPGRYYLSANEAGKLTAYPNGPLIYVCSIGGHVVNSGNIDGTAVLNPQFLDIGTSHVHRTAVLVARPAGTLGPEGYLPIGGSSSSDSSDGVGSSIRLRFGGTWTSDKRVNYSFWLTQSGPDWPNGVELEWTEDGVSDPSMHVKIPGPDIEVHVSHGLTVRVSMPDSTSRFAYSTTSPDQLRWETLTMPDAGMGWVDHEATGIAMDSGIPGFRVGIRGHFKSVNTDVAVAFPSRADVFQLNDVVSGTTFAFGSETYEFVEDPSSYSGSNTAVPLGSCTADSVAHLVSALSNAHEGSAFALFEGSIEGSSESDSSDSACVVAIDVDSSITGNASYDPDDTKEGDDFKVAGNNATGASIAVVFDGYGRILTDVPVLVDVGSYSWKNGGNVSIMVFQDYETEIDTIEAGTVVRANVIDDEPDAVYDYVLGMDQLISNYWPPVPVKSAALIVNGVEMDNKALVPHAPTVSFGRDTIHWFEDDEGKRPWPEAFERRGAEIEPALDKSEVMHWVRGFQGATGPVTSLQVKEGSPLKINGFCSNETANTGDLEISADFDFDIENGGAPGYQVPKRTRNGKLLAGPVVERIVGGTGVKVISSAGCPPGQGTVVIALENGAYGNQFSDIALENSEQAKIGMFPYIRLRGYSGASITSPSAFTATVRVPTNLPDGRYAMRISASVFGESGFEGSSVRTACVKLAYNILPDFSAPSAEQYRNLKTGLVKPDGERTVLIPLGHQAGNGIVYNGFDPLVITTADADMTAASDIVAKVMGGDIPDRVDFALQGISPVLRPGYLVGIRISRAVTNASGAVAYTDALGFINLSWSLVAAK